MRIIVVAEPHIPVPPPKYGGTEKIIHYLIKGLKEQGHEVILLASGDSKEDCEVIPTVDKHIRFPSSKSEVGEFKKTIHAIHLRTERILQKLLPRADIIHSHGFDLRKFYNFPSLTTLHGMIDLNQLRYFLRRKDLCYASISRNQQDALPDLRYIGVVYNGEDPAEFPLVEKPEDYVCFVGRFDREKNPHLAIQLAINLGIKIKVAGKRDFQAEGYFDEEVAKYLGHPLVEYLGELNFDQTREVLSKARCNLHPTGFREPFGLTVLEAAYSGTPTLAIERGSMPELIEEGKTGMLVEDFVEGYHQIEQCFKMDRSYIAARTRKLFNYKLMARQYEKAYMRVLDIFNARQKHIKTVQKLAKLSEKELTEIWQKN